MEFSIERAAKDYIYRRFPNASVVEKEKYVKDWTNKINDSLALVEDFKQRVGEVKGKKVLDVGCGNGGIAIAFAMNGAEVSGVEIEEELFNISKQHAQALNVSVDFEFYDGNILPFLDNTFDYAVSASVLEHTDDPKYYLHEILRVVKPGGAIYLGFPNKWMPRETHTQLLFLSYLPKFAQPIYIKLFHRNPLEDNNLHFYSYFDLKKIIKDGRFGYRWSIVEEQGASQNVFKKIIKSFLSLIGISYKAILPHILVVMRKEKI